MSLADHVKMNITMTIDGVTAGKIQVGDHIIGYRGVSESNYHPTDWRIVRLPTQDEPWCLTDDYRAVIHVSTTALLRVKRRMSNSQTKADDGWNGKCPRCRKNTYTGMNQIEHEGGVCLQAT